MNSGAYCVILWVRRGFEARIGSLGELRFEEGYYAYVGSALRGLRARVRRHLLRPRTRRWHIDYLTTSEVVCPMTAIYGLTAMRVEEEIAKALEGEGVPGFGCSDTRGESHLKYLGRNLTAARARVEAALEAAGLRPRYLEAVSSLFVDLDGTLVDYDVTRLEAVRRLGPRLGVDPERLVEAYEEARRRVYRRAVEDPSRYSKSVVFSEVARILGIELDPAEVEEAFWEEVLRVVGPCEPREPLERLIEAGIRLYLLSDGDRKRQSAKLRVVGLGDLFEAELYSSDLGVNKTSPRAY
ncbi:MAG: hypothetical protein DRO06_02475, partial [Thermoproteota archaeon]